VIELDASGDLIRASSSAEPLLAELSGSTPEAALQSASVHAVASATRAGIGAVAASAAELPSAAVKTPAGTWLVLHGALLGDTRSGAVAVFIQRAHPTLVAPLLLKAFGLTRREQESPSSCSEARRRCRRHGAWPSRRHTVTDHIKSIFEKTGARTRGELSATLFFGQHLPASSIRSASEDDASFIDAPRLRS
jgi:hypothetical protein